jgi:LPS O-antigen subunit length determinant protein (WzzB/FepE family)
MKRWGVTRRIQRLQKNRDKYSVRINNFMNFNTLFEQTLNGLSKDKTLEDLSKKHNTDIKDLEHQLEMGIKVETEHTKDVNTAKIIAMDHLFEDPLYYTHLA